MAYVWVGIDEWVMVDKAVATGLVTNGLSGCVGIMLQTQNRCLLAHLYSACTLKTWKAYKPYLIAMLNAIKADGETISEAALAFSDEHTNERVTLLRGFLFWELSQHPGLIQAAGCLIKVTPPREVRGMVDGRLGVVQRPAEAKFLSIKAEPSAANGATKSHQAHGMILGGGRLDEKPWPHVLSDEDERD